MEKDLWQLHHEHADSSEVDLDVEKNEFDLKNL